MLSFYRSHINCKLKMMMCPFVKYQKHKWNILGFSSIRDINRILGVFFPQLSFSSSLFFPNYLIFLYPHHSQPPAPILHFNFIFLTFTTLTILSSISMSFQSKTREELKGGNGPIFGACPRGGTHEEEEMWFQNVLNCCEGRRR